MARPLYAFYKRHANGFFHRALLYPLLTEERELLRNVEVENSRLQSDCESLKLRLEGVQSEKASGEEFEDFQNMRQVR